MDKGDYFELRADMPGFKKEEIHIDVDGDRLTISAQHKEETEEEKGHYVRRERRTGSLTRSFEHLRRGCEQHFRRLCKRRAGVEPAEEGGEKARSPAH